MFALRDKVAWITGASSGIGEALAYALADKGATLVLSARHAAELEQVKTNCNSRARVEILLMDMEEPAEIPSKVQWVYDHVGAIDILINCAGISQRSFAGDTSMEVYRKIMEVNYFATIQLSLAVLKKFIEKNEGHIVVISSLTGKIGLPFRTAYVASKHALEGFFSALRTETWRTNIKILVVRPGAVNTRIALNALQGDGSAFNKTDKLIQNGISAKACAQGILKAIEQNKRVLEIGSAKERLLLKLNRFLPKLAFDAVKKLA